MVHSVPEFARRNHAHHTSRRRFKTPPTSHPLNVSMARIPKIQAGAIGEPLRASGVAGDLRIHEFRSRVFRNTRFVRVWLPTGYDEPQNQGQRYPVFYLNDGQNLFEASTAFGGVEWQADETADRMIREGAIPP